jgi:hypothetical protein
MPLILIEKSIENGGSVSKRKGVNRMNEKTKDQQVGVINCVSKR